MPSKRSDLRIVNFSNSSAVTHVTGVDDYDWDGSSRPHRNFNNVTIPSKGTVQRRAELNVHAKNCPFTMTLNFANGLVDTFRINQKFAIGKAKADFVHSRRSHDIKYLREGHTLVIQVFDTLEHKQNAFAEALKKSAEADMRQKQALLLALDVQTISSIKTDKAEALYQLGNIVLQQAWDFETKEKPQEANTKFNEAKTRFQQAEGLRHTTQQQNGFQIVTLKTDGNQFFNDANNLEKTAFQLFETARKSNIFDDYMASHNKYKEALVKYEAAKKKFEEGQKLDQAHFGICVKITSEQIQDVLEVIEKINKAELNYNFGKVYLNEKEAKVSTDEQVHVNDKLQEEKEG